MILTSLGDLALSHSLKRQNAAMKVAMQRLSVEAVTNTPTDPARRLRGDFQPLATIDSALARLKGYKATTTETALFTAAMQAALTDVSTDAAKLAPVLLNAGTSGQSTLVDGVGAESVKSFETAVARFNTRLGDRSLYAGKATDRPALAEAAAILSTLASAVAGATSAQEVSAAVDAWFSKPEGFASSAYLGGAPLSPLKIAEDETAGADVTAADPAIRDTLQALALGALLDRGVLSGRTEERAALARQAGTALLEGQVDRAALAARIGTTEGKIAAAEARNSSETSALEIARAGLLTLDPYETASALSEAQTQLEALYAVTARLSRLSLVDYLA